MLYYYCSKRQQRIILQNKLAAGWSYVQDEDGEWHLYTTVTNQKDGCVFDDAVLVAQWPHDVGHGMTKFFQTRAEVLASDMPLTDMEQANED